MMMMMMMVFKVNITEMNMRLNTSYPLDLNSICSTATTPSERVTSPTSTATRRDVTPTTVNVVDFASSTIGGDSATRHVVVTARRPTKKPASDTTVQQVRTLDQVHITLVVTR